MGQPIDTASVEIVPDFSAFDRQLRAGVTNALRGVIAAVERAFDEVEAAAGGAGRAVGRDMQIGGERAELALREVATTAEVSMAKVAGAATAAGATMSSRLAAAAGIAKTALLGMTIAVAAALAATVGFGLKSAASLEQTTIGLEALTGSAQTAQDFLKQLQQFAAATPFEFSGVADASRRILAFGQSVGITREQVIPTLTTIGDLVSVLGGTQENVDSVVRALGQMASKGKLSQEEILQLAEALPGFNANAAIAAATGHTVSETLALITAGGIDATTGINALLTGMKNFKGAAGAMQKQSQSLLGVFSTFKDTVAITLTNAFQPVIPAIKTTLTELTPVIGDALGKLAPALGQVLTAILPLIGSLLSGIVPIIAPLLSGLAEGLAFIGPALKPLGDAFGHVATALKPILPLIGKLVAVLATALAPIIDAVGQILDALAPVAIQLVEALLPLIPAVLEIVVALTPLLVLLAKLVAVILTFTTAKILVPVVQALAIALGFLAKAVGEFSRWLASVDWASVGNAIGSFFVNLWHDLTSVSDAFTKFPEVVSLAFNMVRQTISDRITQVIADLKALPGRVTDALSDLGTLLVDKGRDLIAGLWNGISSMGGWLVGKITSFVHDKIIGPVTNALGIHSPSTVAADMVGEPFAQGVGVGLERGVPDLQQLIGSIVPGRTAAPAVGGTSSIGPITIQLMFNGAVPTEGEARAAGVAAGNGVAEALQRRAVGLAVRTA